jgi:hypothetical protein
MILHKFHRIDTKDDSRRIRNQKANADFELMELFPGKTSEAQSAEASAWGVE